MTSEITITLPTNVSTTLSTFIAAAKKAFGDHLLSVVLYGSGAEGKLRPTSDVNLLLLLSMFDRGLADQLREPLRLAQAAIKLRVMFLWSTNSNRRRRRLPSNLPTSRGGAWSFTAKILLLRSRFPEKTRSLF